MGMIWTMLLSKLLFSLTEQYKYQHQSPTLLALAPVTPTPSPTPTLTLNPVPPPSPLQNPISPIAHPIQASPATSSPPIPLNKTMPVSYGPGYSARVPRVNIQKVVKIWVQSINGTFFYSACAVDPTMLVALYEISQQQSNPTAATLTKCNCLIYYAAHI